MGQRLARNSRLHYPAQMLKWRGAYNSYLRGEGNAVVVAIGDSITEGFYAASGTPAGNVRDADMWVSRASNALALKKGENRGGRYMPLAASSGLSVNNFGPWPETTDPWTRNGLHQDQGSSPEGIGLRAVVLGSDGAYAEITAPSWATQATVYYSSNAGNAHRIAILSNSIQVFLETLASADAHVAKSARVPLQGSGNLLRIRNGGATGAVRLHGVAWEKGSLPVGQIIAGVTDEDNATTGNTASIDLTGPAVGDLMVLMIATQNIGTQPATPSGWDSRAIQTIGTNSHVRICTRTKQSGDTSVTCGGGGLANTQAVMAAYPGADFSSISTTYNDSSSGTTIDPASLSFSYGDSSLILVACSSGRTFTFPTGWTQNITDPTYVSVGIAHKLQDLSGTVDPSTVTISSAATNRAGWQINLVRTNDDQTPISYLEVLDGGKGGREAFDYSADNGPQEMYDAIELAQPDLILIMLGLNDGNNNRSKATFKSSLETMITDIDATVTSVPDIGFVMYPYLDWTYGISIGSAGGTAYTAQQWAEYEDAVVEISKDLGSERSEVLLLSHQLGPYDGTDPGFTSGDGIHPDKSGHNTIGDIIAEWLS